MKQRERELAKEKRYYYDKNQNLLREQIESGVELSPHKHIHTSRVTSRNYPS
jgi:hypothetical protein